MAIADFIDSITRAPRRIWYLVGGLLSIALLITIIVVVAKNRADKSGGEAHSTTPPPDTTTKEAPPVCALNSIPNKEERVIDTANTDAQVKFDGYIQVGKEPTIQYVPLRSKKLVRKNWSPMIDEMTLTDDCVQATIFRVNAPEQNDQELQFVLTFRTEPTGTQSKCRTYFKGNEITQEESMECYDDGNNPIDNTRVVWRALSLQIKPQLPVKRDGVIVGSFLA